MPSRRTIRLISDLDWAIAALERLRRDLPEIVRRREFDVSDGFPAASGGGGSSSSGPSDPTARAATVPKQADPIGRIIDDLMRGLQQTIRSVNGMDSARELVFEIGESERGRQSTVRQCRACNVPVSGVKNDRIRTGYCFNCYQAWTRWRNRPTTIDPTSHIVFMAERVQHLADEATKSEA